MKCLQKIPRKNQPALTGDWFILLHPLHPLVYGLAYKMVKALPCRVRSGPYCQRVTGDQHLFERVGNLDGFEEVSRKEGGKDDVQNL